MAEIVELPKNRDAENRVTQKLRDVLARAEAGEFVSAHLCLFRPDGDMERHSAGAYETTQVVAALEIAKHLLIKSASEE